MLSILFAGLYFLSGLAAVHYAGICVRIPAQKNLLLIGLFMAQLLLLSQIVFDDTNYFTDSTLALYDNVLPFLFGLSILVILIGTGQFVKVKERNGWEWKNPFKEDI